MACRCVMSQLIEFLSEAPKVIQNTNSSVDEMDSPGGSCRTRSGRPFGNGAASRSEMNREPVTAASSVRTTSLCPGIFSEAVIGRIEPRRFSPGSPTCRTHEPCVRFALPLAQHAVARVQVTAVDKWDRELHHCLHLDGVPETTFQRKEKRI